MSGAALPDWVRRLEAAIVYLAPAWSERRLRARLEMDRFDRARRQREADAHASGRLWPLDGRGRIVPASGVPGRVTWRSTWRAVLRPGTQPPGGRRGDIR